jgi:hypothetical protein
LNSFTSVLTKLKGDLERESYKWVQELKQLKLEEAEINKRMKENERKAARETDPSKKAFLLQLIEDDGKKLKANLKKQQELSNKFNFDPNKKVDDLIEAMKKSIEKGGKDKGSGSGNGGGFGKNRNPNNSDSESDDDSSDNDSDDNNPRPDKKDKDQPNFFQSNQSLILMAGTTLLIFFLLYSPKKEKPAYNYDF